MRGGGAPATTGPTILKVTLAVPPGTRAGSSVAAAHMSWPDWSLTCCRLGNVCGRTVGAWDLSDGDTENRGEDGDNKNV